MTGPMRRGPRFLLTVGAVFCVIAASRAEPQLPVSVDLPPVASKRVVLRVGSESAGRTFTIPSIERLGLYRIHTSTFWPADDGTYEGVLFSELLRAAGLADAPAVRVMALDGFAQVIPREDWTRWPIIVATRRDSQPMSRRNKGPLRIIYPRDSDARLRDPSFRRRWVWTITAIEPADR